MLMTHKRNTRGDFLVADTKIKARQQKNTCDAEHSSEQRIFFPSILRVIFSFHPLMY